MDGKENMIIVKSNPDFEWERKSRTTRRGGAKVGTKILAGLLVAALAFGGGAGGMSFYNEFIADDSPNVIIRDNTSTTSQTNNQQTSPDASTTVSSDGAGSAAAGGAQGDKNTVVIQQVTPERGGQTTASQVYGIVSRSTVLITCETDNANGSLGSDPFGIFGGNYGSGGNSGNNPFGSFGSGDSGSSGGSSGSDPFGSFGGNYGSGGNSGGNSGGSQQPQTSTAISYGSGVIMTSDGYIMTNAHVVDGVTRVKVQLFDGRTYDATVIGADENTDIAVIKIKETGLPAAVFGNSDSVMIGDEIYVVGNPLGVELVFSLTCGNVSSVNREVEIQDTLMCLLQIDAAVNPGNSGGPMADISGNVIGIINAKMVDEDVEGIGFAIPANTAIDVASQLIKYGKVADRPMLGITVESIQYQYAIVYKDQAGITVTKVDAGSCAEKAGMQVGDKITHFNGVEVYCNSQLNFQKAKYKVGDTVTVTVERDGQSIELTVVLEAEKD